ncbi:putative gtpase binding protein rid1 [Phaeomoniella chlamydospora]|uniref:Putative gtpase binding protein rid1 n=1 Tax=Phaeomoniella chlamydospora TaxID=158046 RepID=A0A0G2HKT0_PHACM|nr:putative gtpase binding protein rid1 [Phaeomoniella chlamydospora]
MNQSDYPGPGLEEAPPRPPFLQHKSSRSSIFTEEGVDADYPVSPHYKIENDRPKSAYFEDARPSLGSRPSSTDQPQEINPKRSSRVVEAFQALTSKTKENRDSSSQPSPVQPNTPLSPQEIDAAFENVLDSRNIPHNMRDKMRSMDLKIKADFVKSHRVESGSSVGSRAPENLRPRSRSPIKSQSPKKGDVDQLESKRSRSKARGRGFTLSKGDNSPTKKQKSGDENRARSRSRPKSIEIVRPGSSRSMTSTSSSTSFSSKGRPESGSAPADFIHYLREVQKPELVEVGKMHKLRILLRNESVAWTDTFITSGGMDEVVSLLHRIIKVEWREEHEDTLLHETLLCLKGLCTTDLALQRLTTISDTLFPSLLAMLFDPERKGPAEFSTRSIIISLLFMHLTSAITLPEPQLTQRSRKILSFLADPTPEEGKQPLDFISQMHINRPYRVWCKEIVNVTKEVFWIFLHHLNVIPVDNGINSHSPTSSNPYLATYYPQPPPPHPAAPYVGGVEWEATLYLAAHLDLLNGLIVTLPTTEARNQLRQELKDSGVEKVMGATMRTAKEKFYGHMHIGLRFWVNAAIADGWKVEDVREGPPREAVVRNKSPMKKNKKEDAPPKLDLKIGLVGNDVNGNGNGKDAGTDGKGQGGDDGGWL